MSIYIDEERNPEFWTHLLADVGVSKADHPDGEDVSMLVFPAWGSPNLLSLVMLGYELHRNPNRQFVLIGTNWPQAVKDIAGDPAIHFDKREEFAEWLKAKRPPPQI